MDQKIHLTVQTDGRNYWEYRTFITLPGGDVVEDVTRWAAIASDEHAADLDHLWKWLTASIETAGRITDRERDLELGR